MKLLSCQRTLSLHRDFGQDFSSPCRPVAAGIPTKCLNFALDSDFADFFVWAVLVLVLGWFLRFFLTASASCKSPEAQPTKSGQ